MSDNSTEIAQRLAGKLQEALDRFAEVDEEVEEEGYVPHINGADAAEFLHDYRASVRCLLDEVRPALRTQQEESAARDRERAQAEELINLVLFGTDTPTGKALAGELLDEMGTRVLSDEAVIRLREMHQDAADSPSPGM